MRKIFGFAIDLMTLIWFVCMCLTIAGAQQIPLTGAIGVPGSAAVLGYQSIVMTDANRTLTPVEWAHNFINVTSSTPLTATRSLIGPLNPGQQFVVANNTAGGQNITVIGATGTGVILTNGSVYIISSDGVNYTASPASLQANAPGTKAIQNVINGAGTSQSVTISSTNVPLAAPVFNSISATAACGTLHANTTYTYAITSIVNGVEGQQLPIQVTTGGGSNNYCVSIGYAQVGSIATYNTYGRTAGSEGLIWSACSFFSGTCRIDDGSITPGAALPPNTWTNPNNISVNDARRGVLGYGRAIQVDKYGAQGDGITDDTVAIQAAATASVALGVNAIEFTPGHTYVVNQTTGVFPLPIDYGHCPSGSTVGGAACTTLSPETISYQAYSIWIQNNFTIYGNGATIVNNNSNIPSLTVPATFLCQGSLTVNETADFTPGYTGCQNLRIHDLNVAGGLTPLFVPGTITLSYFDNFNSVASAFAYLGQVWDKNFWSNSTFTDKAGPTIGNWWVTRGNSGTATSGPAQEQGGYCDGCNFINTEFLQYNQGAFLTDAPAVNSYFLTYFYKSANNTNGRLTDVQGTSSPSGPGALPTLAPFVGVYGNGLYVGSRSLRADNGEYFVQFQGKATANYLIYFDSVVNGLSINTAGTEAFGECIVSGTAYIVGDPVNCPNPYARGNVPNVSEVLLNLGGYGLAYNSDLNVDSGVSTINDTNQDSLFLRGANFPTSTVNSAPLASKLTFAGWQFSAPGNGAGAQVADNWVGQSVPNVNITYGGIFNIKHLAVGVANASGFGFGVPYLAIAPDTIGSVCDAPSTGYSGHAGWFRYIAGTTGVSDQVQVCSKNSSNAYSWTTIAPFYLSNNPAHILTGTVSPTDLAGTLTAVSGTATYTFVGTLTAPPYCLVEDDTLVTNLLTKTVTSTTLTVTTTGPTDSVTYHCFGSTGSY